MPESLYDKLKARGLDVRYQPVPKPVKVHKAGESLIAAIKKAKAEDSK